MSEIDDVWIDGFPPASIGRDKTVLDFISGANCAAQHLEGKSVAYIAGFLFASNHLDGSVSYKNELHQGWLKTEAEKYLWKGNE